MAIEVMSIRSLASVKAHFSAVVDSVHDTHERVIVTRNGEPAIAIVAVDDLESLEETLAFLQDPKTMEDLAGAEREVAAGETITARELRWNHGLPASSMATGFVVASCLRGRHGSSTLQFNS
jgi:prevent-host-death family protein